MESKLLLPLILLVCAIGSAKSRLSSTAQHTLNAEAHKPGPPTGVCSLCDGQTLKSGEEDKCQKPAAQEKAGLCWSYMFQKGLPHESRCCFKPFGPSASAPAWKAKDRKTVNQKTNGRFPTDEKWGNSADYQCCKDFNCAEKGVEVDCRRYPAPQDLDQATWAKAMTANFGKDILTKRKGTNPAASQKHPGLRGVSLTTLRTILKASREMFPPNKKLTIVNKQYYPDGVEKAAADLTMHEINGLIVQPVAAADPMSWAEYYHGNKPTYFISHNWQGRFQLFVETVEAHFALKQAERKKNSKPSLSPDTTFYWVCTFANDQFTVELSAEVDEGPFATAIQEVVKHGGKELLAIQDDEMNAGKLNTLERIWCVFEMYYALEHGANIFLGAGSTKAIFGAGGYQTPTTGPDGTKLRCESWKKMVETWNYEEVKTNNNPEAVAAIEAYMKAPTHANALIAKIKDNVLYNRFRYATWKTLAQAKFGEHAVKEKTLTPLPASKIMDIFTNILQGLIKGAQADKCPSDASQQTAVVAGAKKLSIADSPRRNHWAVTKFQAKLKGAIHR